MRSCHLIIAQDVVAEIGTEKLWRREGPSTERILEKFMIFWAESHEMPSLFCRIFPGIKWKNRNSYTNIIICINYDIVEKPASQTSPFFLNLYWASRASQCVVLPLHSSVLVRKPTLLNCTLKAAGCSSLPSLGTEITRTAMCLSLQVALCCMRTSRLSTTQSSWAGLSVSSWITSCRRSNAGSCTAWPVWGPEAWCWAGLASAYECFDPGLTWSQGTRPEIPLSKDIDCGGTFRAFGLGHCSFVQIWTWLLGLEELEA